MKALVYTDVMQLEVQDLPEPREQEGSVIVEVKACGICGSDMHAWHGQDPRRVPPLTLGHEIAGTIVSGGKTGQKVTMNPLVACGECVNCTSGRDNICLNRSMLGMDLPGGFSEYLSVPNQCLIPISDDLSFSHAALTEPVAVCINAVNTAKRVSYNFTTNNSVLIIGAGAIGLLTGLVLNANGIQNITLCDNNQLRLDTARTGIDAQFINNAKQKIDTGTYDLVFDAVGSTITRNIAIDSVIEGGSIVHIGLQNDAGEFNARRLTIGEITFAGVYTYTMKQMHEATGLLTEGELGDLNWLDHRTLTVGQNAFEDIHHTRTASPKILLYPGEL